MISTGRKGWEQRLGQKVVIQTNIAVCRRWMTETCCLVTEPRHFITRGDTLLTVDTGKPAKGARCF